MEPKEEVLQLTKTLNDANYRYYVLDDPTLPDFEYDGCCGGWRSWRRPILNCRLRIPPPSGWAARPSANLRRWSIPFPWRASRTCFP